VESRVPKTRPVGGFRNHQDWRSEDGTIGVSPAVDLGLAQGTRTAQFVVG